VKSESLFQYVGAYLGVSGHPDYRTALNGLQVEGRSEVGKIAASVDASEVVIQRAVEAGVDVLLVHHGLFWDGLRPVTGRRFRKLKLLLDHGIALYSVHLPLDGHAEVGNAALLAGALGLGALEPFGEYKGVSIGWSGRLAVPKAREEFADDLAEVLGGSVRTIEGGEATVAHVGVVTGSGGSFLEDAVDARLDALVTGEASHHTYVDANELGVNVFLGGHYATETFGVKALATHLAERFSLEWAFIDEPTGM